MRRRIFTAINLPNDIKRELSKYSLKWPELPARWTKPENLHITLEFLGYVADDDLLAILRATEELALKHAPFDVALNKICYGPLGKMSPRMIWAVGERIKEFDIAPHITLARIRTWQWKQIEPEERPDVSEQINLSFPVDSIEVMESRLKRGGPEYIILESYSLKS